VVKICHTLILKKYIKYKILKKYIKYKIFKLKNSISSIINMEIKPTLNSKDFWGPSIWKTIHIFAATYQPSQKKEFKSFISNLQYLLPCEACRKHLKDNLETLKIDNYLDNNHNLFLWSYFLHDIVNKQLNKTSPPYETVKTIYFKGLGNDCTSCKL